MKENIEYVFKGLFRAFGESFCFYVLLPLWYAYIRLSEHFKEAVKGFDN